VRGGHTMDQDLYKKCHRFLPGVNTTRNLVEAFHRPQVSSAFISQGLLNRNHPACHRQLPPSQPPTTASLIIATQITHCRLYIAARSLTFITCTSYVHHMDIACTSSPVQDACHDHVGHGVRGAGEEPASDITMYGIDQTRVMR
jgi:hypothetical protein